MLFANEPPESLFWLGELFQQISAPIMTRVLVLGYGREGRKTFGGGTGIRVLIDQGEVEKMGVSQDLINLGQLH